MFSKPRASRYNVPYVCCFSSLFRFSPTLVRPSFFLCCRESIVLHTISACVYILSFSPNLSSTVFPASPSRHQHADFLCGPSRFFSSVCRRQESDWGVHAKRGGSICAASALAATVLNFIFGHWVSALLSLPIGLFLATFEVPFVYKWLEVRSWNEVMGS